MAEVVNSRQQTRGIKLRRAGAASKPSGARRSGRPWQVCRRCWAERSPPSPRGCGVLVDHRAGSSSPRERDNTFARSVRQKRRLDDLRHHPHRLPRLTATLWPAASFHHEVRPLGFRKGSALSALELASGLGRRRGLAGRLPFVKDAGKAIALQAAAPGQLFGLIGQLFRRDVRGFAVALQRPLAAAQHETVSRSVEGAARTGSGQAASQDDSSESLSRPRHDIPPDDANAPSHLAIFQPAERRCRHCVTLGGIGRKRPEN